MSEVSEILAEVEECLKVIFDPSLIFPEKRNAYVDAGAVILPKIQALLSSHAVINKETAQEAERACVESEFLHQSAVIQAELSRLSTHKGHE